MEPPGLFVHSPDIVAPPSKPAPTTPRDAVPVTGFGGETRVPINSHREVVDDATRLPREHMKVLKKSNSFDGFQHNFNVTRMILLGLTHRLLCMMRISYRPRRKRRAKTTMTKTAPLPPGIHRRPSKNSHMFLNEFAGN